MGHVQKDNTLPHKISKKRLIIFAESSSEHDPAIYKNVHNVQNFVYNYKNKQFVFENAQSPDKQ